MFETDLPVEIYGRLLEGAYMAGHSFERVCTHLEWLLQEDRWRKVGRGFDDVNAFLGSIISSTPCGYRPNSESELEN